MRRFFAIALLSALIFSLCGCDFHPEVPADHGARVITAITVTYENGPLNTRRHYTTDIKMQQILNYLRRIDPYGQPETDPETAGGSDFYIELTYSDGSRQLYRQKADRFMLDADGIWKRIDPGKAAQLSKILGLMESDG